MKETVIFIFGMFAGIVIVFVGSLVYAKRQPRKVAESMMKFELQTEEQNVARLKSKIQQYKDEHH